MVIVSKYSGRSDLFDSLMIHKYTEEELKNNVKIYIGSSYIPLEIESYKSLIPYYPHLVCTAAYNNKEQKSIVHITSESSVDRSEREVLESYLKRILKYYDKCKRNKTEFVIEDAIKSAYFIEWNKEQVIKIAKRVELHGKKANIDGIHLGVYEHYRKILADEMLRNSINLADYGLERFNKEGEISG